MLPRCIAIGASAGGLEPLIAVLSQLPRDFAIPVYVAMHVPPYQESLLPEILSRAGPLPAVHPEDRTKVSGGHVYVAPPDHHLLIDDGFVAVKRGPKENGFRPSIDALLRSAAYSYGPGAVGVILSGALSDGTSGLWSIKRLGGTAVVQDPRGALYPSMPRSAMEYVEADYQGSPAEIGSFIAQLAVEQPEQPDFAPAGMEEDARRLALETQIAAGVELPEEAVLALGELSPFTCPECKGVLTRIVEGNSIRFRCHTGHGFTADALLEGLVESVNIQVWQADRGYQEGSMLLQHLARHLQQRGETAAAERFLSKSRQMARQASNLQKIALGQESLSEEKLLTGQVQRSKDTASANRD